MECLQQTNVTNALTHLAEVSVSREATILNHQPLSGQKEIEDEETDSDSPLFDYFYEEGGSAAIVKVTNFSPPVSF